MTAACDSRSSSTCCSRLKQDTHILSLNFQIFSIKKYSVQTARALTLTFGLGRTSRYSRHTAGLAGGGVKRKDTNTCTGSVPTQRRSVLFFTLRLLLVFFFMCVSILFQMSCVCMRKATKDNKAKKTERKREGSRVRQISELSGADVSSTGCKQQQHHA